MKEKRLVFMEHDGAIDDIIAQVLLLTMSDVEVLGINVTPADCYIKPAIESTYKILVKLKRTEIPIGRCDLNGVNNFPQDWRGKPAIINMLPDLINIPYSLNLYNLTSAYDLLTNVLETTVIPITILVTGPCSNIVKVLEAKPDLRNRIKQIIWMAGAFNSGGNVLTYDHNGSAEWNIYWDPISAYKLFKMELPLTCIPLDVTNKVLVKKSFLSALAAKDKNNLSNLICQLWALTVDTIPSYYYTYYMWDVLATSFLAIEEHFIIKNVRAKLNNRPPSAGRTIINQDGFKLKIATDIDVEIFYKYLLKQFDKTLSPN